MKHILLEQLADLSARAAASPRLRANWNLHPTLEDPIQRLMNALEPGTYVRPHRHEGDRWELFLALVGRAVVLSFDEAGRVSDRAEISSGGPSRGVEIPCGTWHTVAALDPGTVVFEVKPGPYLPPGENDFAAWAPPEGDAACAAVESWYRTAGLGEAPPEDHRPRNTER